MCLTIHQVKDYLLELDDKDLAYFRELIKAEEHARQDEDLGNAVPLHRIPKHSDTTR